jgi:hypothetical protein
MACPIASRGRWRWTLSSIPMTATGRISWSRIGRTAIWILVERVPGETVQDGLQDLLAPPRFKPPRKEAGEVCEHDGWYSSPAARVDNPRYFRQGQVFHDISGNACGAVFWYWDGGPESRDRR